MQPNVIQSKQAKLFLINGQTITFLQQASLFIQKTADRRYILGIGALSHPITPNTLIWFDSPNDDIDHCLVYYFRHSENEDYMIKMRYNTEAVHMAIRASGCQRRDRKVYFRSQRGGILDSLGKMLAGLGLGNMLQGGMERMNQMMGQQNNQQNYQNINHMNPNNINRGFDPNINPNLIRNPSPVRNYSPQNLRGSQNLRASGSLDPNQARDALRNHIIRQNQNQNIHNNQQMIGGSSMYPNLNNPNSNINFRNSNQNQINPNVNQNNGNFVPIIPPPVNPNINQNIAQNVNNNIPYQNQNMQNPLNYYSDAVGNWINSVNLNQYTIPNEQDHPIVRAGKNMLGGAINLYYNGVNGLNNQNQNQHNGPNIHRL